MGYWCLIVAHLGLTYWCLIVAHLGLTYWCLIVAHLGLTYWCHCILNKTMPRLRTMPAIGFYGFEQIKQIHFGVQHFELIPVIFLLLVLPFYFELIPYLLTYNTSSSFIHMNNNVFYFNFECT